jgi:hypothetical protein
LTEQFSREIFCIELHGKYYLTSFKVVDITGNYINPQKVYFDESYTILIIDSSNVLNQCIGSLEKENGRVILAFK